MFRFPGQREGRLPQAIKTRMSGDLRNKSNRGRNQTQSRDHSICTEPVRIVRRRARGRFVRDGAQRRSGQRSDLCRTTNADTGSSRHFLDVRYVISDGYRFRSLEAAWTKNPSRQFLTNLALTISTVYISFSVYHLHSRRMLNYNQCQVMRSTTSAHHHRAIIAASTAPVIVIVGAPHADLGRG